MASGAIHQDVAGIGSRRPRDDRCPALPRTGDLCDRLTILAIKGECSRLSIPPQALAELSLINRQLWTVEELLRSHQEQQRFDQSFIALARFVDQLNDQRSALKRQIGVPPKPERRESAKRAQPHPTPQNTLRNSYAIGMQLGEPGASRISRGWPARR